ncbi:MAG: hypothetical protein ACWGMZ_00300 [Thermoguttaceae bacterium]
MTDQASKKTSRKELDIQWVMTPGQESFVNQLLVQYDGDVFHLHFANLVLPPILGKTQDDLDKISKLPVMATTRIAIPPDALRRMVEILQKQLSEIDKLQK